MSDALVKILAIVSPIAAIVFSWLAFSRNKRKDEEEFTKNCHVVIGEIGRLKDDLAKIIAALDRKSEADVRVLERLVQVEASAKQAHKRLDEHLGKTKDRED